MPDVEPAPVAGEPLIGAFGNVNQSKRVPQLLEAFARVRGEHPGARLLLVGATSPGFDLERRLQRLGLDGEGIVREGYVDERRLWALMAACDVHVSLRSPTMGETSGTAIRALSLGKPLVVSDVGWFAELPDDVALKVPVGDDEVDDLAAALELLAERRDAREAMGAAARALATGEHDLERVAERQAAAFERVAGGGAVADDGAPRGERGRRRRRHRAGHARGRGDRAAPRRGRPRWLTRCARASPACRLGLARRDRRLFRRASASGSCAGCPRRSSSSTSSIYSELARSLAAHGDASPSAASPTSGYSLLYPVLLAPAYGLVRRAAPTRTRPRRR